MIFRGFLRWKWQRDKGQGKSQLTHRCAHARTLSAMHDHTPKIVGGFVCVCGGAFKCARRSAVLSISQRCLCLKIKPACWSGGNTQENQSYNYPDFLCHLKQRRTLSLTAVLARGRASVTVLISANFVIGSMVPSILPAASRVFRGESVRPCGRQEGDLRI